MVKETRESIWSVERRYVRWTCDLVLLSDTEIEALICRNGQPVFIRRFESRGTAIAWAEEERAALP